MELIKGPFLRALFGPKEVLRPSQKWLVISNCQTVGLANSLSLLSPQARVDACNLWQLRKRPKHWKARLGEYDQLFFAPQVREFGLPDLDGLSNITWMPSVIFGGFHPDLCYIRSGKGVLKGPLDDYHSLIAITAYKQGLSPAKTAGLYRRDVFQRIGYFDLWSAQRAQLFADFSAVDWDIRDAFLRWVRRGVFMHSPNHPHIEVLFDQARMVVEKLQGGVCDGGFLPHDNLASGPAFPVFPEIAEGLGMVGGSLLFKAMNEYRLLDLEAFLENCFAIYARHDKATLTPLSASVESAARIIAEEA